MAMPLGIITRPDTSALTPRSFCKYAHRVQEQLAGGEGLDEERGDRDHDALVSMNPVVSHCTVLLGTSNSCINVGRAEIISVWLRMATNEPIIRVMTMAVVLAGVVLLELAGWWSRPQRWPARNCVTSIIKSRFLG